MVVQLGNGGTEQATITTTTTPENSTTAS